MQIYAAPDRAWVLENHHQTTIISESVDVARERRSVLPHVVKASEVDRLRIVGVSSSATVTS